LEELAKAAPSLLFTEQEKIEFKDDETQVILRLMGSSLGFMWATEQQYWVAALIEKDRIVHWLLANFVDFFAADGAGRSSMAMGRGITTRAWTRDELKELYRWSVQYVHSHAETAWVSANMAGAVFHKFLPRVSAAIDELETLQPPSPLTSSSEMRMHANAKQAYHIFEERNHNICLYPHYAAGSLITNSCAQAMHDAPAKLRELELEELGDFELITHMLSFGGNLLCFLLLLAFFSQRKRMEKRMEKGRRHLEQELNDPFLRQVLEKKATALPEDQRAGFTSKLESKTAKWDTRGAALKLVRRQVRTFRFLVLFNLFLTTLVNVFLWTFHVTSGVRFLENAILSILVLTASYAVPLADPNSDTPSAVSGVVSSDQELPPLIPATRATF
jgi:hypothetical protein